MAARPLSYISICVKFCSHAISQLPFCCFTCNLWKLFTSKQVPASLNLSLIQYPVCPSGCHHVFPRMTCSTPFYCIALKLAGIYFRTPGVIFKSDRNSLMATRWPFGRLCDIPFTCSISILFCCLIGSLLGLFPST